MKKLTTWQRNLWDWGDCNMADITMLITKMNEAFGLVTEELSRVADALNELFRCFGREEDEEELILFSSPKRHGIFPRNNHQIHTKSLYKPPFVPVPRHLAYQRRHYQG